MKTYIVYDSDGKELTGEMGKPYIKARNHNEAEKKAKKLYGEKTMVVYTEI